MTGLEEGASYELRVRPANAAGVGMASMATDPVCAKAVEGNVDSQSAQSVHRLVQIKVERVTFDCLIQGAQEVSCTVDQKSGDIVLMFESCQMNEGSHFVWKRDYKEITEFSKGEIKTEGNV